MDRAQAVRDLELYLRCAVSTMDCHHTRLVQAMADEAKRFKPLPSLMSLADRYLFEQVYNAYKSPERTLTARVESFF